MPTAQTSPTESIVDMDRDTRSTPPYQANGGHNAATNSINACDDLPGPIHAVLLKHYAEKWRSMYNDLPFEQRLIPAVDERFAFARAFCASMVETSERYHDPLIKKQTTLLLTVIATCLITGPNGEARNTRYHDIGAMMISASGARPCMKLSAPQADSLVRFLIDLTHCSAAKHIPEMSTALQGLVALAPDALGVVAEIAIRAIAAIVGQDELMHAVMIDDEIYAGEHDYMLLACA